MGQPERDAIEGLLAEYAERREAGEGLDPESFLAAHPEGGEALRAALASLAATESLFAEPLGGLPASVGPYRVLGELGSGGMGRVLRVAHEARPETELALKLLHGALETQPRALERFRREAEALQRVEHPGVVRVHDAGVSEGRPFLVMDLVRGESLATQLAREREQGTPLDAEAVARTIARLARAVAAVHAAGVLHRDLNPRNVLIREDGEPILIDFGLVHADATITLTGSGDLLGTPQYMSPEQARGERVDERADVYGLGAILHEMLSGEAPRGKGESLSVLREAGSRPLRPLRGLRGEVPRALLTITRRATSFVAARRSAGATALAEDLEAFVEGRSIHARPPGLLERGHDTWLLHARAIVATLLILLAGTSAWVLSRPAPHDVEAQLVDLHHAAAVAWLDQDLAAFPDIADALEELDPAGVMPAHLRALANGRLLEDPEDPLLSALVDALRHRAAGRGEEAFRSVEIAWNINRWAPEVVAVVALLAYETGRSAEATEVLESVSPFLGSSWRLHLTLAELYAEAERPSDVLKAASIGSQLAPANARLWELRAQAHRALGDDDAADEAAAEAARLRS